MTGYGVVGAAVDVDVWPVEGLKTVYAKYPTTARATIATIITKTGPRRDLNDVPTAPPCPAAVPAARGAPSCMVSPVTATFSKRGAPPPLLVIDSRSLRMVRTFTSDGGGGAPGIFP